MAAEAGSLILAGGGGACGSDVLSGRSPLRAPPSAAPVPASSRPASPADGAGGDGSAGGNSATPQPAQSSSGSGPGGSSGANGSGAAGTGSSPGSNSSGKPRAGQSADSNGASPGAGRSARASGSSQPSPTAAAQAAGGSDDFSATLAQSLAAAPADDSPPAGTATGKGSAKTGSDEPGSPATKHSDADPVSSALALLENALSGALAGAMAGVPAQTHPTAASASGASSQESRIGAGKGPLGALETLLGQDPAPDTKTAAPSGGSSTAAGQAAATAAAAALTATQLAPASAAGSPHARPDPAMAVSAPVGSSGWTDELGAKVTWMAHQGIESASLQLSPEHLGPLQVTISVHDGQASVWFGAAQPDTRMALQQSLPQLRQLFAGQGLTLADAGVSRESPRGQDRQRSGRMTAPVAGVTAVGSDTAAGGSAVTRGLGLVDTYA